MNIKTKNRFLSLVTAAAVISAAIIPVSAVEYGAEYKTKPSGTYDVKFQDVQRDYWAFNFIGEMQERGVLNGYPNGYYYPDNYVERCEFAKIMVGAAGLRLEDPEYSYFCDVKYDDWFFSYVETAKNYLTGYKSFGENYFRPNNYALREDIAVALVKLKGYDTKSADQNMLKTMFSDCESISESAKPYVAAAVERGLVSGYEDGTFRGQDSISRAEAAAMLWRAFQYGNDNKTTDVSKADDTQNISEVINNSGREADSETKSADRQAYDSQQDKTPYAVKTLAKATISNSLTDFTVDGRDNVYYINRSDNSLYRVSSKGGSAKKITSLSKLKYQETETREETVQIKTKAEKPSDTSDKKQDEKVSEPSDDPDSSDDIENKDNNSKDDTDKSSDTTAEKASYTKSASAENVSGDTAENTNSSDSADEYTYETKTIEKEVIVARYSDFSAQQVYYDKTSDKVWLVGYFNTKVNEDGQEGEGRFWITLNADDLSEVITKYEFKNYNSRDFEYCSIVGSLPNGQVAATSANGHNYIGYIYLINPDTKEYTEINMAYNSPIISAVIQNGNKLFVFDKENNRIYTYNFSSKEKNEFKTEFPIRSGKMACGNNSFYFWNVINGVISAFSPKTEKFRTLDVNAIDDVELIDGGYISANGNEIMKVTSNESFVFADKDAGAIRILYKK